MNTQTQTAIAAPTMAQLEALAVTADWRRMWKRGGRITYRKPDGGDVWLDTVTAEVSFGFWVLWNQATPEERQAALHDADIQAQEHAANL